MRTVDDLSFQSQLLFLSILPFPQSCNSNDEAKLCNLLSSIEDWVQLLKKACYHRLQPRLYSFLRRNGAFNLLDVEIWKKIEAAYHQAQFQVMALEGELITQILPSFNEANIQVMLLKGAALLQTVYRENPIRFFVDLDLLIHPEDLSKAQVVLEKLGYRMLRLSHFPSVWHEREIGSRLNREFTFVYPQTQIAIDLHTEAFEPPFFHLNSDWLWSGAAPIDINGNPAFLLGPNHQFVYLLLHLAKHATGGDLCLGWLADLDECLRYYQNEMDGGFCWEILRSSSHAAKILEILAFLESRFASPLPEKFRILVEEKKVAEFSLASIFSSKRSEWGDPQKNFLFYWGYVSGFRKKLIFLWYWLFPDREYLETKYPFRTFQNRMTAWVRHWCEMGSKAVGLALGSLGRYTNHRRDKKTNQDPEEIDGQEARRGVGLSQSGERRILRFEQNRKPRLGPVEREGRPSGGG